MLADELRAKARELCGCGDCPAGQTQHRQAIEVALAVVASRLDGIRRPKDLKALAEEMRAVRL
jgi:hypothetical protein